MSFFDAFWHLMNFWAPAASLGPLAALLAKLCWRRELRGLAWWRLAAWAAGASAVALVAGLMVFGHDGQMATYGMMAAACATGMWWAGFRGR